jgi:hypothetical protein
MALHVGCIGVEPQSVAVRCALQFSSMHMCGVPDCCGILILFVLWLPLSLKLSQMQALAGLYT